MTFEREPELPSGPRNGHKSEARNALSRPAPAAPAACERSPLLLPSGNSHGSAHHRRSSVRKTFGNIVISIVGAGVLGLPYTFKQSGWVCGGVVLVLIGLACYYTMMLMVYSKRRLESEGNDGVDSYSELGYATFGKGGKLVVDLMLVLSQGGFCVGYLIFIGQNLASVFAAVDHSTAHPKAGASTFRSLGLNWEAKDIYVWIIFPFQVWLASVRSLTTLAPFSICADAANVIAMLVVMREDILKIRVDDVRTLHTFTGWSSLPFVLGVAIYAFEGFGLVLPIESSMKDRSKFGSTLASALGFTTFLFMAFAALGYFAFGDRTQDIITLNLGNTWQTILIKLALCLGLFFTFPVMMHPVHDVMERRFKQGRPSFFLRSALVLLIAWTAVGVPHFGDFLSLMGSSVCSTLSFVLPPLFHLRTHSGDLSWWQASLDYGFIVFGISFGFWGTWTSLHNW